MKETLADWRRLRSELGLSNDNDVAVLLQCNKTLTDILASEGRHPASSVGARRFFFPTNVHVRHVRTAKITLSDVSYKLITY